ncbi:NADPH-dependent FMN reductase [Cohnella sp. CIP 111063]|jgi:azobenzene reductase|uniref:NADPH-dependent FMN reductase n=1 Tax=unclassified Cohnella TaxID=2636738 RepID=UPI000B8BD325|nr:MULTISPECIES: NADPH-dependent FMN reductase [unclassified Cohnella]OXS55308.1 NADPH-dependent FMN reductase [Cohnella sp. CIP 111063]PRX65740.1 NAD(P)H-dependent FMN reductase [Cohnella sp. SGD-V74]
MKIVLIAGSNRKNATSTLLLKHMEDVFRSKNVETTFVDLYDKPVPLYCPDDETPDERASFMIRAVAEADAIVLGTPEYHGSISGVLKNALDYLGSNEVGGKAVLSVSSSGGAVGVSSLTQLQAIVRNLHGINSPEWLSLGGSARQFGADGSPTDAGVRQRVVRVIDALTDLTSKLRPAARVPQK